mmetsp:Transcript_19745/g.38657  ORF Transcript_19745/g.38657 Transcript_19745/m.38657 type:complete len:387 (+) Transcript_19745:271-1431(+)|eukprot:CAMPEP_0171488126 /NCGR_PEP_ID=MMETSP0958-20121227/2037_1 /TAXON_ID=87120 /ORGANISM="Aurantiochytrium limacinum, Strain ATCCMYA-1381" /LENGTH=386 /DNA_ID=CAMNT_0012021211 /DNA_START=130 /DNA_END=1290 /DNA_ORIENTATION=+
MTNQMKGILAVAALTGIIMLGSMQTMLWKSLVLNEHANSVGGGIDMRIQNSLRAIGSTLRSGDSDVGAFDFLEDESRDTLPETVQQEQTKVEKNALVTSELTPKAREECFTPLHRLEKIQMPRLSGPVQLASFPGSGNTWIRHVIQQGTRIYTGSMYNDTKLRETVFPAEGVRDESVVVVKTHFPCANCWLLRNGNGYVKTSRTGDLKSARASLYILRSPFDVILAEFQRLHSTSLNHTGVVPEAVFQSSVWFEFIDRALGGWIESVDFYLSEPISGRLWRDKRGRLVFVFLFENFVRKFDKETSLLLATLREVHENTNALPSPAEALACLKADRDGSFKRKPSSIKNPYSPEIAAKICARVSDRWHNDLWGPCTGQLQRERTPFM